MTPDTTFLCTVLILLLIAVLIINFVVTLFVFAYGRNRSIRSALWSISQENKFSRGPSRVIFVNDRGEIVSDRQELKHVPPFVDITYDPVHEARFSLQDRVYDVQLGG